MGSGRSASGSKRSRQISPLKAGTTRDVMRTAGAPAGRITTAARKRPGSSGVRKPGPGL
jgi:hypothetical protein